MKEIARLSGVSRATVSAVLNDKPGVAEKTREKVLSAIRESDLQHSQVARFLLGQFSRMVGVVIPSLVNPFYTDFIEGLQGVLVPASYYVITHATELVREDEARTLEEFLKHQLPGYVLATAISEDGSLEHIQRIIEAGRPLVSVGTVTSPETHSVDIDNQESSKKAADYLIEKGHRNIVGVGYPESNKTAKNRILGFIDSLMEGQIPYNESMIVRGEGTCRGGYEQALHVLTNYEPRPTALLCYSDFVAIGVYKAANELGLRIPEDVSVIGFDGTDLSDVLGPPLTTVAVRPRDMGRTAGQILLDSFNGKLKKRFVNVVVRGTVVEGASVRAL